MQSWRRETEGGRGRKWDDEVKRVRVGGESVRVVEAVVGTKKKGGECGRVKLVVIKGREREQSGQRL